jgi:hypothetical protein
VLDLCIKDLFDFETKKRVASTGFAQAMLRVRKKYDRFFKIFKGSFTQIHTCTSCFVAMTAEKAENHAVF